MQLDPNRLLQRFLRRFTRRKDAPKVLDVAQPVTPLPGSHIEALQSLSDRDAFKDVRFLNRRDGVDYTGVPPWIAEFLRAFQAELERYAIPMVVSEIYRDPARQAHLKAQGRSKAAPGLSTHKDLAFFGFGLLAGVTNCIYQQEGDAVRLTHSPPNLHSVAVPVRGAVGKPIAVRGSSPS